MLASRPASEAELLQSARAIQRRNGTRFRDGAVVARLNEGRWLGDCVCRAGVAIHPEWARTGCMECGRVLVVTAPENYRDLEDALLERTNDRERHWTPGKTVEDLREETRLLANSAHDSRRIGAGVREGSS
jgi:hypothetical protein